MTILERFNRRVIEAIHVLPYEEAVEKEEQGKRWTGNKTGEFYYDYHIRPITIGRVMQALEAKEEYTPMIDCIGNFHFLDRNKYELVGCEDITWKLTKENGQECTSKDQTEETLIAILKLLEK